MQPARGHRPAHCGAHRCTPPAVIARSPRRCAAATARSPHAWRSRWKTATATTSRRRRAPHAPAKPRPDRLRNRKFQPPDPTPALLYPYRRFLLPDSPIRCRPRRRSDPRHTTALPEAVPTPRSSTRRTPAAPIRAETRQRRAHRAPLGSTPSDPGPPARPTPDGARAAAPNAAAAPTRSDRDATRGDAHLRIPLVELPSFLAGHGAVA